MAAKETFVLYKSYLQKTERLSDEQLGVLFRAILRHESGLDLPEMDALTAMAFDFIRVDLDANAEKYDEECERNRKNAQKRWHKDNANASDRIQPHTKDATASECMPTDTDSDTDSDKDNKTPSISPPLRRQIPPTVEMVREYCNEKGFDFDPQAFVDHYESNGWMVGKTKMKDWQASCRTWAKSPYRQTRGSPKSKIVNIEQHDYDFDETERALTMIQVNGYG